MTPEDLRKILAEREQRAGLPPGSHHPGTIEMLEVVEGIACRIDEIERALARGAEGGGREANGEWAVWRCDGCGSTYLHDEWGDGTREHLNCQQMPRGIFHRVPPTSPRGAEGGGGPADKWRDPSTGQMCENCWHGNCPRHGTGTAQAAEVKRKWCIWSQCTRFAGTCPKGYCDECCDCPAAVASAATADLCRGCYAPDCSPLWGTQSKCCPDCSHQGLCEARVADNGDYLACGRPAVANKRCADHAAATAAKCVRCGKAADYGPPEGCEDCYARYAIACRDGYRGRYGEWAAANPIAVEPRAEAVVEKFWLAEALGSAVDLTWEELLGEVAELVHQRRALESAAKELEALAEIGRAVVEASKDHHDCFFCGAPYLIEHSDGCPVAAYLASKPAPPGEGKP